MSRFSRDDARDVQRRELDPARGETESTRVGKEYHRSMAETRRASGEFDLVNSPVADRRGDAILVAKRFDLETGRPLPESGLQEVVPDAVRFRDGLVIDDSLSGGRSPRIAKRSFASSRRIGGERGSFRNP